MQISSSSSSDRLVSVKRAFTCLTVLLFSAGLHADADPSSDAPRDHVLFITIDDLNDWIGCMTDTVAPSGGSVVGRGHPQASTPNMDRLVERGVLFTNAHCQAPICRPSRNSFMSGLRPTTSGIYGNRSKHDAKGFLKPGKESPWLTKRFEQAGYHTFNAGKILHGSRNKPLGGTACFKTTQGPYPPNKLNVPKEITPASIWDIGAISAFFGLSNRIVNMSSMRTNDEFYLMGRIPR